MEQQIKSKFKKIVGIVLVILGLLGLLLPVLPGWIFIFIGLEIWGWRLVFDRKKPWREMITFIDKTKEKIEKKKIERERKRELEQLE